MWGNEGCSQNKLKYFERRKIMFDFFEGLIEKLGVKLISDFTDKIYDQIKDIKKNSNGDNNDNGEYSAKIGSSGNYAKIEISGDNSIGFACGYKSMIKAKKGTWISLAEYRKDKGSNIVPIFAKSAQIGNKEFKDYNGKILKANTYYMLWKKEFYPVDNYDGIWTIKLSEHKRENIKIIKAVDVDTLLDDKVIELYIATEGKLSAHGYTVREAVEDLTLKKLDKVNTDEIVKKIKETGKVTRSQYRAITGACSFGTNKFCEEHNIQDLEEIELTELRKILVNDYGAEKFWNLIDKNQEELNVKGQTEVSSLYRRIKINI